MLNLIMFNYDSLMMLKSIEIVKIVLVSFCIVGHMTFEIRFYAMDWTSPRSFVLFVWFILHSVNDNGNKWLEIKDVFCSFGNLFDLASF